MVESKYNIGDKVRIRQDITRDMCRDGVGVNSEMVDLAGELVTIRNVRSSNRYEVDENNCSWQDELFEGIKKIQLSKTKKSKLINQIIKEIKENKEFNKCFKDVNKEVNEWSDEQIKNYKLD